MLNCTYGLLSLLLLIASKNVKLKIGSLNAHNGTFISQNRNKILVLSIRIYTDQCNIKKVIIIFLHELGRLTCSGIDALPLFPGASTISSSSRFVVEGVFRESVVVQSFKVVDPVLSIFESHVLYSRDL